MFAFVDIYLILDLKMFRHFGLVQTGKLRGTRRKGRNSAVQSSQLSGTGHVTKSMYSTISSLLQSTLM